MHIHARIRYVLAALAFLCYSIPAAPHLYLMWLWCRIRRAPPSRRRRLASHWRSWWGSRAFEIVARALGMRARISPGPQTADPDRPCIVVSNHQSTMDILVLQWALRKLGMKNMRWVLKEQLRHRALYLGHACIMSECAFVRRSGSPGDLFTIRELAGKARHDGAGVIIFPEGTRYARRKPRQHYRHVLPPRVAGFRALLEDMPAHDLLSLTIDWKGRENAKTVFGLASLVGKTITVEWRRVPRERVTGSWLEEEWVQKDARLEEMHRSAM